MLLSCTNINREKQVDKTELTGEDYRLFQNTPAWDIAKAVQDENEKRINEIVIKDPKLINFQESKFGFTLLMLTIRNQQFKPFEVLLKNKANVHIHDTYEGSTALIEACNSKYYDVKFAATLLQYGANVNDVQTDIEKQGKTKTALMAACKTGEIDLVKLLVINGAAVNYQNEYKQSALSEAVTVQRYNVVFYLLNNGIDYTLPISYNEEQNKTYYLVDKLRFYLTDLGSKDYKEKMQIVDFLKSKGIDYRATPIPKYIKKKAQEEYPKTWQEYLDKY